MLRFLVSALAIIAGSVLSDCQIPAACPSRCKQTCATPNPKNCERNPSCFCQNGYVFRDKSNNTCIPLYECPHHLGCVCKSGFILSKPGGKCIPPESCPGGNPCGRNETFSSCSINCPSGDCPTTDSIFMVACSIAYPCPGGCECKPGYRRNSQGKCILAQDCPANVQKVLPCGSDSCRQVLGQQETNNCVVVNPVCNPACVCKPLYARDDNFTCIPVQDCVVKRAACGHNEMEVSCGHCGPKYCEELGKSVACSGSTARCSPQCVCIDRYVRNKNGTCILKTDCPSCGGDKNATSGCGNHCGNSCSDYKDINKTCLSGCPSNGCDCRKGYVYHETLKKCVLPLDCCTYMPLSMEDDIIQMPASASHSGTDPSGPIFNNSSA
ncbi:hypothetical protein ACJJTC_019851 [Scirpophaga incertulas]